jgi:hypothetical protein
MLNFALVCKIMRPGNFNPGRNVFDKILAYAADVSRGDGAAPVPVPKTKGEFEMLYLPEALEGKYDNVYRSEQGWNGGHVQWLVWMARMPVVPFQEVFRQEDDSVTRIDFAASDSFSRYNRMY